jgi:MFS family permease
VARFARDGQRGREFSVLYAIVNLMQIAGPFIGGLLAERYGLSVTLIVASLIYGCSFIPLFMTREIFVPKIYKFHDTWELYKTYPLKFLGYMGFGEELLVLTIWPIFIFLVIHDYQNLGAVVTVSTFIATLLALYIGKITDMHSKRLMIKIGSFFYTLVWLARIAVSTAFGAFATDSLSRTSKDVVFIPLSTVTYERAEATHILPYVVFFEQSLSIGKFLAAVLGIIVFAATGSFVALFVLAACFTLLYMLI